MAIDVSVLRQDFPILKEDVVYFDNAATSQRPRQVLEAEQDFYYRHNANPLRGLYRWSVEATEAYEGARHEVARFLGAADAEIVFVRNTTEAINLVAYSYGLSRLQAGDEIVVTVMEHHSNLLPWQMVARQTGAKLRYIEPEDDGTITEAMLRDAIGERTRIVAMGLVSNVLGVTNPVRLAGELVHAQGGVLVVDAAQGAPHQRVDVAALGADFLALSGHKMLGPFGIGALYGRQALLEEMPPFLSGGEMIEYVQRESATYAELPHKFEAGTVNAADAVGLGAAIRYLEDVGYGEIEAQEQRVTRMLLDGMRGMPHVHVYGPAEAERHSGIVTFNIDGCHPHDVASVLDGEGIAIRAGHHCAQPLMEYMQQRLSMEVRATARASVYFYNTEAEAERFLDALSKVRGWLGYGA